MDAGVTCASCHVGSGAGSFLRAKLAGTRQLVAVMRNSYHRPIVTAPDDLVSSRITCAQCHAPRFPWRRRARPYTANTLVGRVTYFWQGRPRLPKQHWQQLDQLRRLLRFPRA
jgi:hypothetical protein